VGWEMVGGQDGSLQNKTIGRKDTFSKALLGRRIASKDFGTWPADPTTVAGFGVLLAKVGHVVHHTSLCFLTKFAHFGSACGVSSERSRLHVFRLVHERGPGVATRDLVGLFLVETWHVFCVDFGHLQKPCKMICRPFAGIYMPPSGTCEQSTSVCKPRQYTHSQLIGVCEPFAGTYKVFTCIYKRFARIYRLEVFTGHLQALTSHLQKI
jgi:hypothetical protein